MSRIRVLLADDHHVVRAAIASFLSSNSDIEVVGEVGWWTSWQARWTGSDPTCSCSMPRCPDRRRLKPPSGAAPGGHASLSKAGWTPVTAFKAKPNLGRRRTSLAAEAPQPALDVVLALRLLGRAG